MQLPTGATVAVTDGEKFNLFRNAGDEADLKLTPLDHEALNVGDQIEHLVGRERDAACRIEARHGLSRLLLQPVHSTARRSSHPCAARSLSRWTVCAAIPCRSIAAVILGAMRSG